MEQNQFLSLEDFLVRGKSADDTHDLSAAIATFLDEVARQVDDGPVRTVSWGCGTTTCSKSCRDCC